MVERVVTQLETLVPDRASDGDPAPPRDASPVTSGPARYEYLGEIGRGGMGTVHSVRDLGLLRVSAMKVLAPRLMSRTHEIERFLREARITAQLDHPNIVPVHEVGADERGKPYFTMKRVEGRTLRDWILEVGHPAEQRETLREMLDAFLKVCDAVAFAHSRRVIHCDLKPGNVMIGSFGQVYLMDWGLARVLQADPSTRGTADAESPHRAYGRPAGTPSFMSPEQASSDILDERSDIFGLGALLYSILTGAAPFPAAENDAALAQARAGDVKMHSEALARVPDGLSRASLRAMSRAPHERQGSVGELKKEVEAAIQTLAFLETKLYPAGARIVTEGEPGDCAYVVASGSCVALRTDAHGRRTVLRRLEAGAVFGETAVLSGGLRTATVVAEDEVVVSVVSRQLLEKNLGVGTPFGAFVVALASRFRELESRVLSNGGGSG